MKNFQKISKINLFTLDYHFACDDFSFLKLENSSNSEDFL
jgi:hypothetical protein